MRPGPALHRLLSVAALAGALPDRALAQKAQWTDVVYVPGRWSAGRVVPRTTTNAQTDSLALVMRVDYFARAPRWRAEIRRTSDGQTLAAPDVVIGDGPRGAVITPVGATPLEQHALGQDALIRAAVAFDQTGHLRGAASGRLVDRGAGGAVTRVVFRRAVRNPDFADALLDPGARAGGRTLLASGISAIGDQRRASVVATAGARGVDRVKTPGGEVPVRPDSAAIQRMERYTVGAVALEDFLRTGGLGPYAAARSDSGGGHP